MNNGENGLYGRNGHDGPSMPAIGCIPTITEAQIEQAALAWPAGLGYQTVFGPAVAPGEAMAERDDYGRVVLEYRLRQALQRLNPQVPADALEEAFRKLTQPGSPSLVVNNHVIHKYLVEGVPVEYQRADGSIGRDPARLAPCR